MSRKLMLGFVALAMTSLSSPAFAQTTGLQVTTPYPKVSTEAGKLATFDVAIAGPVGETVDLAVTGLPDGWTASFKGTGATVGAVMIGSSGGPSVKLEVSVPPGTADGAFPMTIEADGPGEVRSVPIEVDIQKGAGGDVTLTPDFPGLRGPADASFTFNVTLANTTPNDVELSLEGTGPQGWNVTAEPSGQAKAAAVTVAAGQTTHINLTAKAPTGAQAGSYDVGMKATGEGVDSELSVQVQLTGDESVKLETPDQRLNATISGTSATQFPILVLNTGTAALQGIKLSATPPTDWNVSFSPEIVDQVAPGQSTTVTATITPSSNAIAGDYDITFTATADQATDTMDIRTTITPSTLWGIVGVGVVALTLAALAGVFRKFGRR